MGCSTKKRVMIESIGFTALRRASTIDIRRAALKASSYGGGMAPP